MAKLRANASLTTVAERATKRAARYHRTWLGVRRCPGEWWDAEREAREHAAFIAWSEWREIAQHLRRLASLPEDPCEGRGVMTSSKALDNAG